MNISSALAIVRGHFKAYWKRYGIGLIALFVAVGATYIFLPTPHASGALKGHTVEIYRNAQFRVVFDQAMDRASVEHAFQVIPSVAGTFAWEQNTVVFRPSAPLEKGMTYEVVIGQAARTQFYKPLDKEFRQIFSVLDYPEVVVVAPVDQSVIMQDQILTVLFDHPVHILTKDPVAPELALIEPKVHGTFHWLGTSGFEFTPTNGWPAATTFTVTVPKGTKTADGGSTVEDFVWSFATPNLTVYARSGSKGDNNHRPKEPVVLEFNYPIPVEAISNALVIKDGETLLPNNQFTFAKDSENPNLINVLRKGDYQLGSTYLMMLPKDFTAGVGALGLRQEWNLTIRMDEKTFRVVRSCPSNTEEKDVRQALTFVFNNPTDTKNLNAPGALRITPPLAEMEISSYGNGDRRCWGTESGSNPFSISGSWKPSTTYTATINTGVADIYGQRLASSTTVTFTTKPYEPVATMSSYSMYGILAANLPRLYQLRTLNMKQSITADLCSGTFDEYLEGRGFGCSTRATKTYDPTNTLNQYKILDMDLDEIAGKALPLGAYSLTVTVPDAQTEWERTQKRTVLITDTALTMKRDNSGKILVWATDMKSGQPVPNLTVDVWDEFDQWANEREGSHNRPHLGTTKTDANGLATLQLASDKKGESTLSVRAQDKTHLGFTSQGWDDGISPWNYGINTEYRRTGTVHIGYLYTDRAIYRPDQLVQFKGVIRLDVDAALSVPTLKEVPVTIEDPNGTEVFRQTLPLSEFGTVNGSFQLNPTMALGTYSMRILPPDDVDGVSITGIFDVREYRRPDFKIELPEMSQSITGGDTITLPIHAEYYHGIPLKDATVTYNVTRRKLAFQPLDTQEWYNYGTDDDMFDCYWYCRSEGNFEQVQNGTMVLDAQGNATVTIPTTLTDYKASARYSIDVTVTDVNQRSVATNLEIPVHKGTFYVGIRPDYSRGWDSQDADFNIVSLNLDGSPRASTDATVTLYKRTWSNEKKENTDGSSSWDWNHTDTKIQSQQVKTDGLGKATVRFSKPGNGEFVAIVEARDAKSTILSASTNRYLYSSDMSGVRISDDHQMKIIQNKASYEPGDTASLIVQTPYPETKALLTIERDTIRESRIITIGPNAAPVLIPIKDDSAPNLFVSILTVKGGGEKGIPEFRLGYADLRVSTKNKILGLAVTPDRATYKPGERVTLNVSAKDSSGKPADAEVSIAVVDQRVVALLGSIDKNILGKFWFVRNIGVRTAQTLTALVKKVFFATEGGAGGKGGEEGHKTVRGNFQDTAYWNAVVQTGTDGTAQVSFLLPDNLTSWQILAIGTTKDTVVGTSETSIVTRRELMAEPLVPRILRYDDTLRLGTSVSNSTSQRVTATVSMQTEGITVTNPGTRTVTLEPSSSQSVYWDVHVPKTGSTAKVTVIAKGSGLEDGFAINLPILQNSVFEIVSASGILEKNATEHIELPDDVLPDVGSVKVSVQPNIGNSLQNGLDYLLKYPYGCSEQKTSALLGNLMYSELMKLKVTPESSMSQEAASKNIQEAITQLYPLQRADGGFGYWADSRDSYGHVTAYVLWGLTQAEKAGFSVDHNVMDRADSYLRQNLSNSGSNWGLFDSNERAQVIFMLSERNTDGLAGYANTLYERRDSLAAFGKAFLAMAFANLEPSTSSVKAAKVLDGIKNDVVYLNPTTAYVKDRDGYDWLMSSNLRSTSVYLQALLRIDPNNIAVNQLLRYIVENRQDGYWGTTQNTSMTLLGLVQYARMNPVDTSSAAVQLFLDNTRVTALEFPQGDVSGKQEHTFELKDLLKKGMIHEIGLEKDTDKRWFYDINMKTYRDIEGIQPFDNGFTVTAEIYNVLDAKNQFPLSSVQQGSNVRVHMKVLVPKRHRYVALEYHLPAGLEPIDFSLKTSPQEIANTTVQCAPTYWGKQRCLSDWEYNWWWENVWEHVEQRDDRVFLYADTLNPGIYDYDFIATAVTPGTFRIPPAQIYEFYNPLANAHNEGKIFSVTTKE